MENIQKQEKSRGRRSRFQEPPLVELLAGGIAHDFNNVLNMIRGLTSYILYTLPPGHPLCSKILDIDEQVRSGSELSKELISIVNNNILETQRLNLNEVLKKSSEFFGRTKRSVKIIRDFSKELRPVNANGRQIERVLLNIFLNAAQAMPTGGEIRIKTSNLGKRPRGKKRKLSEGRFVEVSISDNGIGMDKSVLKEIFDPFFTTKESQGGNGLGLSSALQIMKRHGGTITATSSPGTGTTFKLYFPASEEVEVQAGENQSIHMVASAGH